MWTGIALRKSCIELSEGDSYAVDSPWRLLRADANGGVTCPLRG